MNEGIRKYQEGILDFIETCRKFIELDSTPANGTREVAQFAAELCRKAGLHVEIQDETHNGIDQANVIARPIKVRPDSEFLLQTHLDTGDPGSYQLWTKTGANPFNASIYQDTIYGLGAANAKLDFLCKLSALSQLKTMNEVAGSAWRFPCVLVGTFGEELGMPGAIKLIRKKKIVAKMALVGEPTELKLVHAGKGFAAVEIEIPFSDEEKDFRTRHNMSDGMTTQSRIFIGKAAHSAFPQLGESAILKMLQYLTKLPDGLAVMELEGGTSSNTVPAHAVLEIDMVGGLRETIGRKITRILRAIETVERRFQDFQDSEFNPPAPTLNIGLIRTYEDDVKLTGCCRLPPTVSDEVYEEWMAILRSACHEVGAVFRVTDYKPPFRTPLSSSFVKVCQDVCQEVGRDRDRSDGIESGTEIEEWPPGEPGQISPTPDCGAQSVANEANVFSRFGIDCIVFGPGRGVGNSHAPNEHVKISQLHEATRFYKAVLERVCL